MISINSKLSFWLTTLYMVFFLTGQNVEAQKGEDSQFGQLENKQDKNEQYLKQIYEIVEAYPDFSYEYVYDNNGKLKKVIVEGVDNKADKEKLKVWLLEFKKNKINIENVPTRTGIYYSVDEKADPEGGMETYMDELYKNLQYPEAAKDKGVEGTVFVKFVVDTEGEIPFAKVDEDIDSPYELAVSQMRKEAKKAVKKTSGDWEPAEVNNKDVASWVIAPVQFNLDYTPGTRVIY